MASRVEFLNQQNSIQQEQNDELATHVERLTRDVNAVYVANNVSNVAGFDRLIEAVGEAPTTVLSRRKAEWQAEALKKAATGLFEDYRQYLDISPSTASDWLEYEAEELRRQAEEAPDAN